MGERLTFTTTHVTFVFTFDVGVMVYCITWVARAVTISVLTPLAIFPFLMACIVLLEKRSGTLNRLIQLLSVTALAVSLGSDVL